TPPLMPPWPTRFCHSTAPSRSGSTAWTTPDFCPATSARRPFARLTRIGGEAKSKSGPFDAGQLVVSSRMQALFQASAADVWRDHRSLPDARSNARNASLVGVGGSL